MHSNLGWLLWSEATSKHTKRTTAQANCFGLTPTVLFLALTYSSCLTERSPLKSLHISIIYSHFSIVCHSLHCYCLQTTHHFITVSSFFLFLSICLLRQSVAPPKENLPAILPLAQERKAITVPLLHLASQQNKTDTYFRMTGPLFVNLVQKVLLILPVHRHTIVGSAY